MSFVDLVIGSHETMRSIDLIFIFSPAGEWSERRNHEPSDEFCGLRLSSDSRGFLERCLCHMPVPSPASKRIGPPQASDYTRDGDIFCRPTRPAALLVPRDHLGLNTSLSS